MQLSPADLSVLPVEAATDAGSKTKNALRNVVTRILHGSKQPQKEAATDSKMHRPKCVKILQWWPVLFVLNVALVTILYLLSTLARSDHEICARRATAMPLHSIHASLSPAPVQQSLLE